jgi:N-acetylglucosamine-6-phosphate deacetylase
VPTIAGRRVVTAQGVVGPARLDVEGGIVIGLHACSTSDADDVTIVPGFVDLQVNGVDDIDVWSAALEPDDGGRFARLDELLLGQGTTAWLPTLVTAPLDRYAPALVAIGERMRHSDMVLGAHLEGPFLGSRTGAHRKEHAQPLDCAWLDALPDIVRVVTLGPELARATEAISALATRGVCVSIGHTGADAATVTRAVDAGASLATHLFNAMGALHHRDVGTVGAVLADDRITASLIADGVHVHPDVLRIALRCKGPDRLALVTDAVAWRRGRVGEIDMSLVDGAPRMPDGTLAGSALTMDAAVRTMVGAGASLVDAVTMASTTPARLLGLRDRGVIAAGMRADLVALDSDLGVRAVWLAGTQFA